MTRPRKTLWQDEPSARVARAVIDRRGTIKTDYSERYAHIDRMFKLYTTASAQKGSSERTARTMRRNTAARVCDDFGSEVAGNPPTLDVTLRDAGFRAKEQARYYQWYQDAAFEEHRLPSLYLRTTKDSWIAGFGFSIIRDYHDGPCPERMYPGDVFIDDAGCDSGYEPPELVLQHRCPRQELANDYPAFAKDIENHAPAMTGSRGKDLVLVVEAFYADHRHVIACEGIEKALIDEPWEGGWPGAYLVLIEAPRGLWGLSLMDRVASMQVARNYAGRTIQRALRFITPHVAVKKDTIVDDDWTDDLTTLIRCKEDPNTSIRPIVMPAVQPELLGREQWLDSTIREEGMASELFAGGLNASEEGTSGVHLQRMRDMGVRKLLPQHRAVAEFGARLLRELVRGEGRAADRDSEYQITVKVSGITKNIVPSLLELDVESLQIRTKPAGALPLEVSARLDRLNDLHDRGIIDAEEYAANAELAEVEKSARRKTAPTDLIDSMIDDIVYEGKMRLPRALFVKLWGPRMLTEGTLALARAEVDYRDDLENASEERKEELRARLQLLDDWLAWIAKKMNEEVAKAAGLGMPPVGGGAGLPPPGMGPGPGLPMELNEPMGESLAPPMGNVIPMTR